MTLSLAFTRRRSIGRVGIALGVIAVHTALLGSLATPAPTVMIDSAPENLVSVELRPHPVVSTDQTLTGRTVRIPKGALLLQDVAIPALDPPELGVVGIGTMAPRTAAEAVDSASFARLAGLSPGAEATVVLRVEVLGSGNLGRIEVDVSGGSQEIDKAAVAYARALPWIGGMIDGRPATMWVRCGVYLAA